MGARAQLAAAIADALPADAIVIADLRALGEPDPSATALVQLFRTKVAKTPHGGRFQLDFELWVLSPFKDSETAEDDLDDVLDDVLEFLDSSDAYQWTEAERAQHAEGFHGYRIPITTVSQSKE